MTDDQRPTDPAPTTRRHLLLGSAAVLTAAAIPAVAAAQRTPAVAAAAAGVIKIQSPKKKGKGVVTTWKFVATGVVTIPDVVYVVGQVTKGGGQPIYPTRTTVRKVGRNKLKWVQAYTVAADGDDYVISVKGQYSDGSYTAAKDKPFEVKTGGGGTPAGGSGGKSDAVPVVAGGIVLDWPSQPDTISSAFVPYGTLADGVYVRWATMTHSDSNIPPIEPVTIYNCAPDFWLEFDLPEIAGTYTLELYGPTGALPVETRSMLTFDPDA